MNIKRMATGAKQWVVGHKKPLLIGLAGIVGVSIAVQAVYPHGQAVPFASVSGERVGGQDQSQITLMLQERFQEATAELYVDDDHAVVEKLASMGASVDAESMAAHAVEYPWLYRLLPLSIVWYQPQLDRYRLQFDDSRLAEVSEGYADDLSVDPTNAGLAIDDGELVVTAAKSGKEVTADTIAESVKTTRFGWDQTRVQVSSRAVEPSVSDTAVASVKQQAEAALAQQITITVPDHDTVTVSRDDIASWLTVDQADSGTLSLGVEQKAVTSYLQTLRNDTATQPTKTTITTVDGRETDRDQGEDGQGIAVAPLRDRIAQTLTTPQSGGQATLTAQMEPIKSPIDYKRSYTSTQAGLTAYVGDATAEGKVHIAVRQLGGNGWSAYGRADESIASASTYKPYLMLRVLDDIKDNKRKWDDKINGESLSDCFERMIVNSANECAEALIQEYGVTPLTKYLREDRGFSSGTGFTFSEVTQTTARDLARLMVGIEDGSLLERQHRNMVLEKMSRQIYRQGIPAGTSAPVYDKVGFLWDFLHDAAIVRHPQGTYVLVVMTEGKSWGEIASITRQIERILYG